VIKLNLDECEPGTYIIKKMNTRYYKQYTRLVELGFLNGRKVEVITNKKRTMIVKVLESNYIISKKLVELIEVEICE
jgi:Fe2+ transport system protein FeoA